MIDRLYENIGGSGTIKRLVDRFYDRVLADAQLAPFFPNTDIDALRAKQVMFITMLLGQKRQSGGPNLAAAHAPARAQGLNDSHFDAILEHFRLALGDVGVDEVFSRELVGLVEKTRDAVLGRV